MASGWRHFSPESYQQKIFYPKLHRGFAEALARQCYANRDVAGYVVSFKLPGDFLNNYCRQTIAYEEQLEYRIPIADLQQLNQHIIGRIEIVSAFYSEDKPHYLKGFQCCANG